jgi:NAD(P)-dependent dehydrogenase (short-subunit alcohol dehydrogenase family)
MTGVLEQRVVVCVGAGSGIGRAAADAFSCAGAMVAVVDRDQDKIDSLTQAAPSMLGLRADATSAEEIASAIGAVVEHFGRVDSLAVFVGVFDDYRPLLEIPPESFESAFDEIFSVNVRSAFLAVRATAPELRRQRGSIVITLSSSSYYPGRGGALYVASKFALRGAVVQLAHELAPDIRVNGVAPGGTVRTDLRGLSSLGLAGNRLDDRPDRKAQIEARTPLQIALQPEDLAAAYVFLASDAAKGMTGEVLRIDGGIGVR